MTGVLLGLDVGTTSVKAVAVDESGRQRGAGRRPTPWTVVPTGAELDALELLAAVRGAVDDAVAEAGTTHVAAVGVASMGESGVLLDRDGQPLAPVIAWHDRRDVAEVARLADDLGGARFSARTGLPLLPQWSLTKHRWAVDHDETTGRAVRRLGVAEWIVRALGGEECAEQSLASRTGWLDLPGRAWWPEALEWSGAGAGLLPAVVPAGAPLGVVTRAGGCGPLAGAILTVAGHDHQAAAVGVGAAGPGDELDSCGTAEALIRTIEPHLPAAAVQRLVAAGTTVGWHAAADAWCVLGGTQGGLLLGRVLEHLGVDADGVAALDAAAAEREGRPVPRVRAAEDGGIVVDAEPGAGDPEPADLWRGAVAAAADDARRLHDAIAEEVGPAERVVVTGGWARSATVRRAKQDSFGAVALRAGGEPGARGAALLGGLAAGVYGDRHELPEDPDGL